MSGPLNLSMLGQSWQQVLAAEWQKEYFKKLNASLATAYVRQHVFPPIDEVFVWTTFCAVDKVKVVIVGQDPYRKFGRAHGLSFSTGTTGTLTLSLRHIYDELERDIPGFIRPEHGNLTGWAEQGVLLLNSVLTVVEGSQDFHIDQGWEIFTDTVIKHISMTSEFGVVFMLWGVHAKRKKAHIVNENNRHLVLDSCLPTNPQWDTADDRFLGNGHFSQANNFLGDRAINWRAFPQ